MDSANRLAIWACLIAGAVRNRPFTDTLGGYVRKLALLDYGQLMIRTPFTDTFAITGVSFLQF